MRKCNADNYALNTTDCVAVASQAANVYSRFTKCFTYLRYSSLLAAVNSLTYPDLLRLAQDFTPHQPDRRTV